MKEISLSLSAEEKIEIQFDNHWNPIDPNKSRYRSFLSILARSKPSIFIDKWKNVDQEKVKDVIWDSIQLTCTVPDNQTLKNKTLSYCADRWRKFKTNLCNNYVHAEVKAGQPRPNPCTKYEYLDENTWEQFVQMRTTPEALVS